MSSLVAQPAQLGGDVGADLLAREMQVAVVLAVAADPRHAGTAALLPAVWSTLRAAFDFVERFGAPLRLPAWDLHARSEAGAGVIDAVESVRYEPLHVFACDQLLATLATLIRAILPQARCTVCFDYPEPAHFRR